MLTIEETYELSDAIMDKNMKDISEEIGDLMLHMVFYARIGEETDDFDVASVLHGICDKLVKRHPHIYGDVKVENEADVKKTGNKSNSQKAKNLYFRVYPIAYHLSSKLTECKKKLLK
jgi:XTP/dITP diphosphohydrolase